MPYPVNAFLHVLFFSILHQLVVQIDSSEEVPSAPAGYTASCYLLHRTVSLHVRWQTGLSSTPDKLLW